MGGAMTYTEAERKALHSLVSATVPGPWRVSIECLSKRCLVFDGNGMWVVDCGEDPDGARFIAAARTAVPALLDEIERLTAEVTHLRAENVALEKLELESSNAERAKARAHCTPDWTCPYSTRKR